MRPMSSQKVGLKSTIWTAVPEKRVMLVKSHSPGSYGCEGREEGSIYQSAFSFRGLYDD